MPSVRQRLESLESQLRARSHYNSVEFLRRRRQILHAMYRSVGQIPEFLPTPRWTILRPHEKQKELWEDVTRFRLVPAGRRSGKTELAKRYGVSFGCSLPMGQLGWIHFLAPTRPQASQIYWEDLKALVPKEFMVGKPQETDLTIKLYNGVTLNVAGMDEPARIEGHPILGAVMDEFGNMKPEAWTHHLRPALADSMGWAWLIGVPEGRNHYYVECDNAQHDSSGNRKVYSWSSRTVLPPEEIEAMEREMDEATVAQEIDASFINNVGRVYYAFKREQNVVPDRRYNEHQDLIFTFDFNVCPGTANVMQEHDNGTHIIDEVYIPTDSNTPLVCKQLTKRWGGHKGRILLYGDSSGGASGTAKVKGSDWDLIKEELRAVYGDGRVRDFVPRENPEVKVRVNSMNSRFKPMKGDPRMWVHQSCRFTIRDFEGVRWKDGTTDIEKRKDRMLTHLSDGIGYYVAHKYPHFSSRAKNVSEAA